VPRALVVDFVGPYYSKGSLLLSPQDMRRCQTG